MVGTSRVVVGFALAALSAGAVVRSPASAVAATAFCAAFLALAFVASLPPRTHAFSIFTTFVMLGFWAKWVALALFRIPLIEPTGSFDWSRRQWDAALMMAVAAAAGIITIRAVELFFRRGETVDERAFEHPKWYERWRIKILIGLVMAICAFAVLNFYGAFFQIGVNPILILPFPGNAVIAFVIHIGFGLVFSIVATWEFTRRKRLDDALYGPVVEGVLGSISTLSRAVFLIHLIPYAFVIAEDRKRFLRGLSLGRSAVLGSTLALGFMLSIAGVSAGRVLLYPGTIVPELIAHSRPPATVLPPPALATSPNAGVRASPAAQTAAPPQKSAASGEGPMRPAIPVSPPAVTATSAPASEALARQPSPAEQRTRRPTGLERINIPRGDREVAIRARYILRQLSGMVIGRWIGMEGVLVLASVPDRTPRMFARVVGENPSLGLRSSFQKMAKVKYRESDRFTFMTIPGFVGVLGWSGSLAMIAVGSAILTAVLVLTEAFLRRLRVHPFTVAFTGCILANAICQMNFPYLALTLLIEMWFTLALLGLVLSRIAVPSKPMPASREESVDRFS